MTSTNVSNAVSTFHRLHESGCFVIPNPWNEGTAIYLQSLGFKALATTSAGFGFARGLPDAIGAISCDAVLKHVRQVVAATPLPVNADFQEGYADSPEGLAENVTLCVGTGVAGLSIEDSTGNREAPLYEHEMAVERIKAAREAIDSTGNPVLLTGRCEAWLVGHPDPFRTAMDRLVSYAEAGADCLYAPGVSDPGEIEAMVRAVHPKPVNVLVSSADTGLTVPMLADIGVRRVSVGSALARTAWGGFMKAAARIMEKGVFDGLGGAASFDELEGLFSRRQP